MTLPKPLGPATQPLSPEEIKARASSATGRKDLPEELQRLVKQLTDEQPRVTYTGIMSALAVLRTKLPDGDEVKQLLERTRDEIARLAD